MVSAFRFEVGNMLALRSRRVFVTVGSLVLLVAALTTAFVPGLDQGNLPMAVLEAMVSVAGVYIPILVILVFAGDWKSGVTHYTLLHFQTRKQVWSAKTMLSLAAAVSASLVCLASSFGLAAIPGGPSGTSPQNLGALLLGVAPIFLYSALGLGLASALLNPWASIIAFIVVTSMDGLLGLLPGELSPWLQFGTAVQALSGNEALSLPASVAVLLWIVPLTALGFRRYQRSEVG